MKRAWHRVLILLLAILFPVVPPVAETVKSMPAPTGYVDDYAAVLSRDGQAQLDRLCHEIHAKTNAQIFVVTIGSLEGETIATFANDLYHQWKIGEKKTDRGALLLLAVTDHKWRIEVGYGLEGALPDAETGRIGRDMVPALKASNYDEAALTGVQAIAGAIAKEAGVTLDPMPAPTAVPVTAAHPATDNNDGVIVIIFIFAALAIFLVAFIRSRRREYAQPYGSTGPYVEPEPVVYAPAPVFFPGAERSPSAAPDYSSSSSDSSSSFGSDSSSSDTFSGGGGGDSGGGGADGSW